MTTTATKIPRLQFNDFGSKGDALCGLEFAHSEVFARGGKPKHPFRVTLWNDGFEATRSLSRDDLESIAEWTAMALRETEAS